jgi:hypothetical protein
MGRAGSTRGADASSAPLTAFRFPNAGIEAPRSAPALSAGGANADRGQVPHAPSSASDRGNPGHARGRNSASRAQ